MNAELLEAVINVLEFTRVAMDKGYANSILDDMDLSDDAWDENILQLKLFYTECTGEHFIYPQDRYIDT